MKHYSNNLDCKIIKSISLQESMSNENAILALQELFLTPGLHTVHVSSFQEGRIILDTFLQALRCYSSIACLSTNNIPLKKYVFDLHSYLVCCGSYDSTNEIMLDTFFIEECNFDFIWIEHENDSISKQFAQKIQEFGFDQTIPIFVLQQNV